MKIRIRTILLLTLPAVFLLGARTTYALAPTPTLQLNPGNYYGTISLTTMHQASVGGGGLNRTWSIDMINTTGNIDIAVSPNGWWSMVVDIPLPIDARDNVTIDVEGSECRGWNLSGSGFGTAKAAVALHVAPTSAGYFEINSIEFALSSFSARIRQNGKCDAAAEAPKMEDAVRKDFNNVFASKWFFNIDRASMGSLSGTCKSETFGMYEGEQLTCSWRAYYLPPFG